MSEYEFYIRHFHRTHPIPRGNFKVSNSECAQVLNSLSVTDLQVNFCIEIKSTFVKDLQRGWNRRPRPYLICKANVQMPASSKSHLNRCCQPAHVIKFSAFIFVEDGCRRRNFRRKLYSHISC